MGNIVLGSDGIAIKQGIYEESENKKTDLGRFIDFQGGRRFRYCQADGEIVKAHMCSGGAVDADDNTVVQTAMTVALSNGYIGETVINVLLDSDTTKNLYADGLLVIEGGTGIGQCFRIKSNKAGGNPYTDPCELTLYDSIKVALDDTSIITLTKNKYKDVIVSPTSEDATPIGVPLITVTDNYYFWAQTRGYAAIYRHSSGTINVGRLAGIGGAAGTFANAAQAYQHPWGVIVQVGAASTCGTIDLKLE